MHRWFSLSEKLYEFVREKKNHKIDQYSKLALRLGGKKKGNNNNNNNNNNKTTTT